MTSRSTFLVAAGLLLATAGCRPGDSHQAGKSPPPATVAKPASESQLATITLTPEAEERVGIELAEVQRKPVHRRRTLGGMVAFPPGQTIVVSAPLGGTLSVPEEGDVPPPGSRVEAGEPIFSLLPLLSAEHRVLTEAEQVQLAQSRAALASSQIEAHQQVMSAEVEVRTAQIAVDRAELLLRGKAGTQQALDEADARLQLAQRSLEAAQARNAFLEKTRLEADAGRLVPHVVFAPLTGVLSNFAATPGETVVAGQVLFEVSDTRRMWIRVPVYVGQSREIDSAADAVVRDFGQSAEVPGQVAKPIVAPPSADPAAATVDLFYEVANDDGRLRPGEKVAVTLALSAEKESLVVPWSAVLFDMYGGSWVYQKVAPQTFVRRRVDVDFVDGSDAVLARGPEPGAELVVVGAAELFGTEFGFGK
jgi:RND family efflux transporter MFP subunit